MSGTLLEARGLRTGYGRLPVVFNVDLEVKEGEIVALLGANGAGKTTTLRALSGMLPLMAGEVCLDGTSLKGTSPDAIARGGIVHVPQGRGIFPNLRVDETLRLACAMAGIRRAEADARVADVYAVFDRLHERRTQFAGTLSGGEQQMLAIARGLIMKPRLLMIDEMSQGLAPTIVQGLFSIVRSLPEQGVSVLIVEQFVTHALAVASRAYVLEKGEVAFNGKAAYENFSQRPCNFGLQKERLYGALVFVLPSTNGKNALGRSAKLRFFRQLAKLLAKLQKQRPGGAAPMARV